MGTVLGVDTTSRSAYSAIVDDQAVLSRKQADHEGNAESLVSLIELTCREADLSLEDLSLIAVAVGPGSFTGIRTGIATVQGVSAGLGIPVLGISVLLARSLAAVGRGTVLMPYQTASAGEKFYTAFSFCPLDGDITSAEVDQLRRGGIESQYWSVKPICEVSITENDQLTSAVQRVEDSCRSDVFAFGVDYPGELFTGDLDHPGVLMAAAAGVRYVPPEGLSDASVQYQSAARGVGLRPLYVKRVSAKTIEERRAENAEKG